MEITIERPPRTIAEVYEMLPEGTLAELINEQIYMSPATSFFHQDVLFEIAQQIRKHLLMNNLGKLAVAPFDVKLDESKNSVQPDIVVILKSNKDQINDQGRFIGVPNLVIEMLSPGNKEHDLKFKKDLYQKFGVPEYWAVDPETKLALCFQLRKGMYQVTFEQIGEFNSSLLGLKFSF